MDIKKFENFVPAGWVNVKVDRQMAIRLGKYVRVLDDLLEPSERNDLFKKIDMLSGIVSIVEDAGVDIQKKLSLVTVLQYLKEIKEHFSASSSGFLFESFLGSLLNADIPDDNGYADMIRYFDAPHFRYRGQAGRRLTYQIKLYKNDSTVKVKLGKDLTERCDYYVIALKDGDNIKVSIFDGKNEDDDSFIAKYGAVVKTGPEVGMRIRTEASGMKYVNLNTSTVLFRSFANAKTINLGNLDELIANCGEIIVSSLDKIYKHISDLHYHTESIITGKKKDKTIISIDDAKKKADLTIDRLRKDIEQLTSSIRGFRE
jgi:hypothetical protein